MPSEAESAEELHVLLVEAASHRAQRTLGTLTTAAQPRVLVSHATTLSAALEVLATGKLDAGLLALDLPDASNAVALRQLRDRRPDVPIFVLSDAPDDAMLEALRHGAADTVYRGEPPAPGFAIAVHRAIERFRARKTHELEGLVEIYPDAVFVVGLDGTVRFVNRAAVELFGRPREDLLGENLGFSIADGSTSEITILHAGGDRIAELRVSKLAWHEEVAFLAICRDITERKRVALQLQTSDRMASIGTLAAGVAHEINNPLAAVIANLALVQEQLEEISNRTPIYAAVFDELADAASASDRVRQIVRDLKVLSRVEDSDRVPVDVERVLDWTLRMVANQTRHRARVIKDYTRVPAVLANESRLGQVFLNLVVNAADAIPEGLADHHEIRIATSQAAGRVVVTVSDTGRGMTADVQARLFTPFFTTKPVGEGTGLGLAICHRIVEGFGGEITFESTLGSGSRFHVALLPAAPIVEPVLGSATPSASPRRRGRVLVIDDDAAVAKTVTRALTADHDAVAETCGARALERLLGGEEFDVIICDLMMPQVTGMDIYEALLAHDAEVAEKLVFLTGGAFSPRSQTFLDTVPNPRLEKPFDTRNLRAFVNALIH